MKQRDSALHYRERERVGGPVDMADLAESALEVYLEREAVTVSGL